MQTHAWADWDLEELVSRRRAGGHRVSLVVPARNEAATVGDLVARVRAALVETVALVDEIVVIDSDSSDATFAVATEAGAQVYRAREVRPDLGAGRGKGEAMWKSLFVTTGDLLVFMDADLVEWDTHFVPGLLGPLLLDPQVQLVKGFYARPLLTPDGPVVLEGGRVTELVARPLLAVLFPHLAGVVQPLAGEWAVRREHFADLHVPTGYGVELAALLDTVALHGLEAVSQVDLGNRTHRHQPLLDLALMAIQLVAVAHDRAGHPTTGPTTRPKADPTTDSVLLQQFHLGSPPGQSSREPHADVRVVDVSQRPPARPYLPERPRGRR